MVQISPDQNFVYTASTAKFCPNCGANASNNATQSESTVILDTMGQDELGIGNEVSANRKNVTLVLAILFGIHWNPSILCWKVRYGRLIVIFLRYFLCWLDL